MIERFFWFFLYYSDESSFVIFPVIPRTRLGFLKELDIASSEYSGTNISGGGASVTPNEALPHIGRQPRRNAEDDRCNLPALL